MRRHQAILCGWCLQFVLAVKVYAVLLFLGCLRQQYACGCDADAFCDEKWPNLLLVAENSLQFRLPSKKTRLRSQLRFSPNASYMCGCSQGPLNGGVSNGGVSRSGLVLPFLSFLSFLGLSRFFGNFPDLLGDGPGIFPISPFLFLGLLRAPTRNSPERVRDTIWTFPQKVGNTRVWKPPGLASLNAGAK